MSESENSNVGSQYAAQNHLPHAAVLRHQYPSMSALLASVEDYDDGECPAYWAESKRIFLPALLRLWREAGRPEIAWHDDPTLPQTDGCLLCACLGHSPCQQNDKGEAQPPAKNL